jgi:hypothetical protein
MQLLLSQKAGPNNVEMTVQSGAFLLLWRGVSAQMAGPNNTTKTIFQAPALALRLSLSRRPIHNPQTPRRRLYCISQEQDRLAWPRCSVKEARKQR